MELGEIYKPIQEELRNVDEILRSVLTSSRCRFIAEMGAFLLASPGKRIRSALVILSSRASQNAAVSVDNKVLAEMAAAMEIIHIASLIHDDVIDRSDLRHNEPTINSKWGGDISIALGDYLYSAAFDIVASCEIAEVIRCISFAAKTMCEGEFMQIEERGNMDLLEEDYLSIIKKKTASLFIASCHIGGLLSSSSISSQEVLKKYGLNFGIAFQIIDDYLDIAGEAQHTGKTVGQDMSVGEITLPVLNLLRSLPGNASQKLKRELFFGKKKKSLKILKSMMINTEAAYKTREKALFYIKSAKKAVKRLSLSPYRESLLNLADFAMERSFNGTTCKNR